MRDQNATVCVPLSQAPPDGGNGLCTLPDGSLGVYTYETETRWKLRLDHVSDDLPYDIRGVVSIRAYSDEQFLQDFEKSFALNSAKQIQSFGYLTKQPRRRLAEPALRAQRDVLCGDGHPGADPVARVLPPHGADRRLAVLPRPPVLRCRASTSTRASACSRGTYGRFDLNPVFSFPWKKIPWLSAHRAGGRPADLLHGLDRRRAADVHGRLAPALLRAAGALARRALLLADLRRDVRAVGEDQAHHRAARGLHVRLQRRAIRRASRPSTRSTRRSGRTRSGTRSSTGCSPARPAGRVGSAEEIASLEIAQTYAFTLPQTIFRPATPAPGAARKRARSRRSCASPRAALFHLDGRVHYDPVASQVTNTTADGRASTAGPTTST